MLIYLLKAYVFNCFVFPNPKSHSLHHCLRLHCPQSSEPPPPLHPEKKKIYKIEKGAVERIGIELRPLELPWRAAREHNASPTKVILSHLIPPLTSQTVILCSASLKAMKTTLNAYTWIHMLPKWRVTCVGSTAGLGIDRSIIGWPQVLAGDT